MQLREIPIIAEYLGVDAPGAIMSGLRENAAPSLKLYIHDCVKPEKWFKVGSSPENSLAYIEIPPVLPFASTCLRASRVEGDFMDLVYPDGTIVVWTDFAQIPEELVHKKRYILDRRREADDMIERTIRTFVENDKGRWFVFESSNPEWASPLRADSLEPFIIVAGRIVRSISPPPRRRPVFLCPNQILVFPKLRA